MLNPVFLCWPAVLPVGGRVPDEPSGTTVSSPQAGLPRAAASAPIDAASGMQGREAAARQNGSSLIEVLVAVIVLSIGMLSMLWAQTKSMGFERTAEFRNIAAQIASDYADRIRANLNMDDGVARGDRANAYLYTAGYDPKVNIQPYSGPDCLKGTVICTQYDIARFDQQEVRLHARNSLPGGDLLVTRNGSNDTIDIWVLWQQPNVPGLDDAALSSDRFCPSQVQGSKHRPQCLQLGVKL